MVGVVVWTEHDEINLSTDGDTTLKNFLHYRKERLVKEHPNDNAQLLTGIHFEGKILILKFWLPAACGGAALEANITVGVLLLMSFTQNQLF